MDLVQHLNFNDDFFSEIGKRLFTKMILSKIFIRTEQFGDPRWQLTRDNVLLCVNRLKFNLWPFTSYFYHQNKSVVLFLIRVLSRDVVVKKSILLPKFQMKTTTINVIKLFQLYKTAKFKKYCEHIV